MEEARLANYTQQIFFLLSCEDPAYPKVHFLLRLREDVRKALMKSDRSLSPSEEAIGHHLTHAVRRFVVNASM